MSAINKTLSKKTSSAKRREIFCSHAFVFFFQLLPLGVATADHVLPSHFPSSSFVTPTLCIFFFTISMVFLFFSCLDSSTCYLLSPSCTSPSHFSFFALLFYSFLLIKMFFLLAFLSPLALIGTVDSHIKFQG